MKSIRWTINQAGNEFGLDKNTVRSRLKSRGIMPGDDGKFSTQQIHSAICGDSAAEKLRNEILDAEIKEAKLKHLRNDQWVRMPWVILLWRSMITAWRQKIQNSSMPEDLKQELTADMQEIPVEEYARTAMADTGSKDGD